MASADYTLSADVLRSRLRYDPKTGLFIWRPKKNPKTGWNKKYAGRVAGHVNKKTGYVVISIDGKWYYGHRLAVLYMTGEWPEEDVDHKDKNTSNNEWLNLREATDSQNLANRSATRKNKLGVKGVTETPSGTFQSSIHKDGKKFHLGTFPTIKEASEEYRKASIRLFGEFARQ